MVRCVLPLPLTLPLTHKHVHTLTALRRSAPTHNTYLGPPSELMDSWSRMVQEILDNGESNGRGARSGPVGVRWEAGLSDSGHEKDEEQTHGVEQRTDPNLLRSEIGIYDALHWPE